MKKIFLGIIGLLLVVIMVSGCTDSVSQTTKHFDNGVIAFDYPSNMVIEDHGIYGIFVKDGSTIEVSMLIKNYNTSNSNYTILSDNNIKYLDPNTNATKKIISGRTAYDLVSKSIGKNGETITSYSTFIDIGTGQMDISPSFESNINDQKDTSFYKTYQMIVNSFQVK
ncbi:hypothetical protein [Methanobacterium spitsbergense]|uniref:Uncharacterized protein n=1 Tax=Methanobacterium spitsbergense TaxID=2874285 RepID=A0A8T5UR32_9EURY|nr:hypothetical protein [Methanobacterium spitsbergense]MBZ2166452.1 hypothetical protein [Methanobacterium spitsbergense]